MSDTAISSQISAEANTSQTGAALSSADKNSISESEDSKSQDSEFKEILDENQNNKIQEDDSQQPQDVAMEDSDNSDQPQDSPDLVDLNALFSTTILTNPQIANLSETAIGGNLLPAQRQAQALVANTGETLLTSNLVNADTSKTNAEANPLLTNSLTEDTDLFLNGDRLASQLIANFTENKEANLKQLNAQLLSQALITPDSSPDQTLPMSAHSTLMLSHNLLLKPAESMLPAMTVSPDSTHWNNQVGERVNWMINSQMQRAEIRLDPPELGNLDIRLNIAKDNQATVTFFVSNATAKEAIESAIPRLREMFEQQGLNLGNVDVSQQGFQQQQQQSTFAQYNNSDSGGLSPMAYSNGSDTSDTGTLLATTNLSTRNSTNLLDIFA